MPIEGKTQKYAFFVLAFLIAVLFVSNLFIDFNGQPVDNDYYQNNLIPEEDPFNPENTILVAAFDSSEDVKSQADYICDGLSDQAEINMAISELPPEGGTVLLSEGTFHCDSSIVPLQYTHLKGSGEDKTIIHLDIPPVQYPDHVGIQVFEGNTVLEDFSFTGSGCIVIQSSNNAVRRVKAFNLTNDDWAAFLIWAFRSVVENIEYTDCKAVNVNRWGFSNNGYGGNPDPGLDYSAIKNVTFTRCQAINCGRYGQFRGQDHSAPVPYDVGFDLVEGANYYENITAIDCLAEGSYESGFHVEDYPEKKNIRIINCVSRNNGQAQHPTYGSGFTLHDADCINCVSENNKIAGYKIWRGATLINCTDRGSTYGIMANNLDGVTGLQVSSGEFIGNSAAIFLYGGTVTSMNIQDVEIHNEGVTSQGPAVIIIHNVYNPEKILIKDTVIRDYVIGIMNANTSRLVRVQNVSVRGAMEPFINCEFIG